MAAKEGQGSNKGNIENKYQNGKCKSSHIDNYINCESSKHPSQKTEIGRLDKKARTNYEISTRDTLGLMT